MPERRGTGKKAAAEIRTENSVSVSDCTFGTQVKVGPENFLTIDIKRF